MYCGKSDLDCCLGDTAFGEPQHLDEKQVESLKAVQDLLDQAVALACDAKLMLAPSPDEGDLSDLIGVYLAGRNSLATVSRHDVTMMEAMRSVGLDRAITAKIKPGVKINAVAVHECKAGGGTELFMRLNLPCGASFLIAGRASGEEALECRTDLVLALCKYLVTPFSDDEIVALKERLISNPVYISQEDWDDFYGLVMLGSSVARMMYSQVESACEFINDLDAMDGFVFGDVEHSWRLLP